MTPSIPLNEMVSEAAFMAFMRAANSASSAPRSAAVSFEFESFCTNSVRTWSISRPPDTICRLRHTCAKGTVASRPCDFQTGSTMALATMSCGLYGARFG